MTTSEISDILFDFFSQDSKQTAVMIDGPWGCGKTYEIHKIMEDGTTNKQNKYKLCRKKKESKNGTQTQTIKCHMYYISLFGSDTLDDLFSKLNASLSTKVGNGIKKMFSATQTFLKSTLDKKIVNGMIDGLSCLLDKDSSSNNKPKRNKNKILIFDDVERIDPNLSYTTLHGFFNTLLLYGYKIICLCASSNVPKNKYDSFINFQEKTFDRIYKIDSQSSSVVKKYFKNIKDFELSDYDINYLINICSLNIRYVQKAIALINNVKDDFARHKNSRYSNRDVAAAALCTVRIVYGKISKSRDVDSEYAQTNHDYKDCVHYSINTQSWPKYIQENYETLFTNYTDIVAINDNNVAVLTNAFLDYYLYHRRSRITGLLPRDGNNQSKYIRNLHLYSREGNEKISKQFLKDISTDCYKFRDFTGLNDLADFVRFTCIPIGQEEESEIVNNIVRNNDSLLDFNRMVKQFPVSDFYITPLYEEILINAKDKVSVKNKEYISSQLKESYKNGDYNKLLNDLSKYHENIYTDDSIKLDVRNILIEENYFLPVKDLSNELTWDQWSFFITMPDFATAYGLNKEYKDYLNKLLKSNIDSCARNRIVELLKYTDTC